MSLQFCIGGSGAGKSERLYEEVIQASLREPGRHFFIIVPDQFTMQTQKELVLRHPNHGIMNIEVLSFGRLTHRIFEETGMGKQPVLDDTGKSLILRRIAAQCEEELSVIGANIRRIGYIHEVKSAISEFMQYGIGISQLHELEQYADGRGSLKHKLHDLEILYRNFMEAIQGRFVTTEGQLGLLSEALLHSEMIRGSSIVFDGFTGFTPIQHQVIEKLLILAKEVKVAVIMDGDEDPYAEDGEQKLFAFSKKMMHTLRGIAQRAGILQKPDIVLTGKPVFRFLKNPGMAHLEQELFRYHDKPFLEKQEAVRMMEADSPRDEVRQTCIKIRRLIREEGFQYRDIAVVAGDLSAYADDVEELFASFGIPCYVDATKGVVQNPFIEYIRSALQILLQNFSYEAVFRFLRSGLTDISREDADLLENYVLRQGIRGRKRWSSLFVRRSDSEEETELLARVNAAREAFMNTLSPLLLDAAKTREHIEHLYAFLTGSRTFERLCEWEDYFAKEGDLVRAKEYSQIYRLVMGLLEQIYDLIGEEEMTLQEFSDILDAGFGEIQVGTIPQNVDRIVVGDMERTRLKEIKVLFFLGVNDGNIPKGGSRGGIISDIDREFLAQGDFEIAPTPRQQMYIQRLYLYMNMTKPSERLYLSYARIDASGRALRPAYLVQTMLRLFPELTIEHPKHEPMEQQIEEKRDGLLLLAEQLREYAKGTPCADPFFFTLYHTYAEDGESAPMLEKLVDMAFYRYHKTALSEAVAKALYGSVLTGSVSRLERYAACAYSYFLEYGLSLKERELFSFETVDMGSLYHGILEQFSQLLAENGSDWLHFSKELGERLLMKAVKAQSSVYGDSVLFSSAKYQYVIRRIARILKRTIFTLQSQLKQGSFFPEQFEVSFSAVSDLEAVNISLSGQEKMRLLGRIDRIDTCRDGENVYVKVIDYKSGNQNLDIAAVYYGLQLQLVVYMNAAVEMLAKKETGKRIIPAAMLYYHIADPLIRSQKQLSEEMLNEKIRESLRMTGMVNESDDVITRLDAAFEGRSQIIPVERKKDGSLGSRSDTFADGEMQTISQYVSDKVRELGRRIIEGNIEKNPYEYAAATGCDYCAYRGVCGFQERIPGYERRKLESMTKEDALQKMQAYETDGEQ